ncbi:MAG TPA: FtsX-like permease family protein [Rhodanobacteraceae bacterium]|nr:FtsX-like permease family protein [Rhodanobacteraceae bacterium]
MSDWREYRGALQTGLLSAMKRPRHLMLVCAGFFIASATLLVLLTLPAGLHKLAGHTGRDDVVVIVPQGIDEGSHDFSAEQVRLLDTLPGVARDATGHPLIAPQFVAYAKLQRKDGSIGTVLLRGVTPVFYRILGSTLTLGNSHRPRAGHDEFVAGSSVANSYVALDPGGNVRIGHQLMQSVGVFHAGTGFWNSELWMSQDVLQALYNSPGAITSVWVKLRSPAAYHQFKQALRSHRSLDGVQATRQTVFYEGQTRFLGRFIHIATVSVAVVLGLGAILAITNALSLALAARHHELAIMRATGYGSTALGWALVTEVWVLCAACVGIVTLVTFLFWNGHTINSSTLLHAIQFKAQLSEEVVGLTLLYTLLIGTLSALAPIRRAVRVPLVDALRNP